jgi:hypothetical protein
VPESRYLQLRGLAKSAEIRTANFEGREHLVIPVISLIGNSIIHALNAPGKEFVPASVIERSAIEWSGRPCVGDHPKDSNGKPISANDIAVCERFAFGRLANSRFENNCLQFDAWLDPSKAEKVGRDAVRVIERGRNKETIEVSVGAWVEVESVDGEMNGESYVGRWLDIGSDHCAFLPEGAVGACSVESGCGAPRVANVKPIATTNVNASQGQSRSIQLRAAQKESPMTLPKRLMEALSKTFGLRSNQEDGVSDVELRNALYTALRAVEPGLDWVAEVYPDSSTVIYTVFPEDKMLWIRRTFEVSDDGSVTLNDDREVVEPVTRYEPVAAEGGDSKEIITTAAHECTCGKNRNSQGKGDTTMADTKKELIGRLISAKGSKFKEEDRKVLEAFSEERLKALAEEGEKEVKDEEEKEKVPTPPVVPPSTPAQPEAPKPATVEVSAEELANLRSLAAREQQRETEYRNSLAATLKAAKSGNGVIYTDDDLKGMSTPLLEKTIAALGLNQPQVTHDYSTRPRAMSSGDGSDDIYRNPPDPWKIEELQAAHGKSVSKEN